MNDYPTLGPRIVVRSMFPKEWPSYDLSIERSSNQTILGRMLVPMGTVLSQPADQSRHAVRLFQ